MYFVNMHAEMFLTHFLWFFHLQCVYVFCELLIAIPASFDYY
jgi:hypothetical protein